jgi:Na+-transporting NADH:ubiquinone oxidoreductase subunit A
MQRIIIKKGYQLRMNGRPKKEVVSLPAPSQVGVVPMWIPYIKPRLKVAQGDRVDIGSPLFEDKRNPAIHFLSPVGGTIRSIRFGPRRILQAIVIDCMQTGEQALNFETVDAGMLADMSRSDLVDCILKGGLWWLFRELPFRDMPDPASVPPRILVSLAAQEPFQPSAAVYLSDRNDLFAYGLQVLKRLAQNQVVVYADDADKEIIELCGRWLTHTIKGRYPADDPGTVNYHLKKSVAENRAWFIPGQDVVLLARLLAQGRYPTERIIAVGGSAAPAQRHYRTRLGVPIAHLVDPAAVRGSRLIAGGCLQGFAADADGFMGLRETALTVLPEGPEAEFLALFNPGFSKPSYSRAFLSKLNSGRLRYHCNLNGAQRACIACMHCADVCPVDLLPQMIYKAILAEEVEEILQHGLLDCVDCGLCSYVCPSKIELSRMFKITKASYAKEQRT